MTKYLNTIAYSSKLALCCLCKLFLIAGVSFADPPTIIDIPPGPLPVRTFYPGTHRGLYCLDSEGTDGGLYRDICKVAEVLDERTMLLCAHGSCPLGMGNVGEANRPFAEAFGQCPSEWGFLASCGGAERRMEGLVSSNAEYVCNRASGPEFGSRPKKLLCFKPSIGVAMRRSGYLQIACFPSGIKKGDIACGNLSSPELADWVCSSNGNDSLLRQANFEDYKNCFPQLPGVEIHHNRGITRYPICDTDPATFPRTELVSPETVLIHLRERGLCNSGPNLTGPPPVNLSPGSRGPASGRGAVSAPGRGFRLKGACGFVLEEVVGNNENFNQCISEAIDPLPTGTQKCLENLSIPGECIGAFTYPIGGCLTTDFTPEVENGETSCWQPYSDPPRIWQWSCGSFMDLCGMPRGPAHWTRRNEEQCRERNAQLARRREAEERYRKSCELEEEMRKNPRKYGYCRPAPWGGVEYVYPEF